MKRSWPNAYMKKVLVVNFGGQYAHLIARRLREAGLYAVLAQPEDLAPQSLAGVAALVLSGGPSSVHEPGAPRLDPAVLRAEVPILGICYGHQLIAQLMGGRVAKGEGEYGRTRIKLVKRDRLFEGWGEEEDVWMSHADYVAEPPPGFEVLAVSERGYIAAMRAAGAPIYSVQFHPEVRHTPKGRLLFENLRLLGIGAGELWRPEGELPRLIEEVRRTVGPGERVLVAVSGGVDSTTTALLVAKALGPDRVLPVFVNHGLFREGEPYEVLNSLRALGLSPLYVDASEEFLRRLEGVEDCEERRRIIGGLFAEIFADVVRRNPDVKWLAQGTLYPDVIESGAVKGSDRIKSHHNVAGLPAWLELKLLEPLKDFYKDEVRRIAKALGIPDEVVHRHPFPGPGLAVRVMGKFSREKLEIARRAGAIVEEVLEGRGLYGRVWQAFAAVGDDQWVGVKGDRRAVGRIVVVRVVESEDAMTADWARLDHDVLEEIASRITAELPQVTMVTYAVTSKPPSTIEPC